MGANCPLTTDQAEPIPRLEMGSRDFFLSFIYALLELKCFTPNRVTCTRRMMLSIKCSWKHFFLVIFYLHCSCIFIASLCFFLFYSQFSGRRLIIIPTVLVEQSIDPLLSRNQKFVKRASSEWNRQVSCLIALL